VIEELIMCCFVRVTNISARGDRRGCDNNVIMISMGKLKNLTENIAPAPL
jgi:sulfur transfer complex TusBCD TusB component (DsrH family)